MRSRVGWVKRTYEWLSGATFRGQTATGHAQGEGSEEEIEELHDDFLFSFIS